MSESRSFLDRVAAGQIPVSQIDDFVEMWHHGQTAEELHDYLGMRPEEYSLWLEIPEMLAFICEARRKRQSLAQAVSESIPKLRSASGSGDFPKLKSLESWLRRQGIDA